MNLVMDTCVVHADFRLQGTQFEILMDSRPRLGITTVVPEVVIDEVVNKHREQVQKLDDDWKKIGKNSIRLFGKNVLASHGPWCAEAFDYRAFLLKLLQQQGWKVLPYPSIDHSGVVQAMLSKRPPFKSGEYGYRDFLIWQSILEFAAKTEEEIVFVTSNTKDFGTGTFADEFQADLQRIRPGATIALFESLAQFNEKHVLPTLQRLEEMVNQFNQDTHPGFSVKHWASDYLLAYIQDNDYESGFSPLHPDHGRVTIKDWVVEDIEVSAVLRLGNGHNIVRSETEVRAKRTISASDYDFHHADVREFFSGANGSFDSVWADDDITASVAFSLILDREARELIDVEIDRITAEGSTAYTDVGKNW